MAKISSPILEYKEISLTSGITPGDYSLPKKTIKRFLRILKGIDDVRSPNMTEYPLPEILLIAFLAVLGNAASWNEMERFGKEKEKWLRKFLALEHGSLPTTRSGGYLPWWIRPSSNGQRYSS